MFKETVRITADLLTVLRQRIETILRSLVQNAEDVDLLLASRRLMYELRVGDEAVGSVEIRLAGDAGDIQIVQNFQLAQDAVGE